MNMIVHFTLPHRLRLKEKHGAIGLKLNIIFCVKCFNNNGIKLTLFEACFSVFNGLKTQKSNFQLKKSLLKLRNTMY